MRTTAYATTLTCLTLVLTAPLRAATHTVDVGGASLTFRPAQLTIAVGDTVTWTNQGGSHNVVSTGSTSFRCANGCDDTGGDGDASSASWSFSRTFNSPATVDYFCEPHGGLGMTGRIVVEAQGGGEPGQLQFSAATSNVQENVGTTTITVRRVNGSAGPVSAAWSTGGGSATANADYTSAAGTVSWADGDSANKTFAVTIVNDTTTEGAETIGLVLANPTGGATLGNPSSATITILANDQTTSQPGSLAFSATTFHGHEEVGLAEVTVVRSGGSDGSVGVTWATTNGTATSGSDFVADSGILTWGPGVDGAQTFMVELVDDTVAEADEELSLTLSGPTGGATLGAPATATVMIMDNDLDTSGPCVAGATTLCLGTNGRFRVEVDWATAAGTSGAGAAVPLEGRADSGLFYFFNPNNIEMLVKVLNACPVNERFWVFFAATTTVEFTLTVVDTEANSGKIYVNPQGQPANAVTDTNAFGTCP